MKAAAPADLQLMLEQVPILRKSMEENPKSKSTESELQKLNCAGMNRTRVTAIEVASGKELGSLFGAFTKSNDGR